MQKRILEAVGLRQQVRERFRFEGMVGESAAMERVYESVQLVADSTASVLVTGENGDRIMLRRFTDGKWSPSIPVTGGGLDVWRPSVAVDAQANVTFSL